MEEKGRNGSSTTLSLHSLAFSSALEERERDEDMISSEAVSSHLANSSQLKGVATRSVGLSGLYLCLHTTPGWWNGPWVR